MSAARQSQTSSVPGRIQPDDDAVRDCAGLMGEKWVVAEPEAILRDGWSRLTTTHNARSDGWVHSLKLRSVVGPSA